MLVLRFHGQTLPETGLSLGVLRRPLVTRISPSPSNTGCMDATSNFVCDIMRIGFFLADTRSNCLQSHGLGGGFITSRPRDGGRSWRGLVCFAFRRQQSFHITSATF